MLVRKVRVVADRATQGDDEPDAGRPSQLIMPSAGPVAAPPLPYRRRNVVERCFNRLKHYRAIAIRYDKTALSYQGWLDLVTILRRP